jgi:hypothetical protein
MKRFFFGRKGIAEMISVVLLVAFSVAIAALVMNWNTDWIKKTSDEAGSGSDLMINCNLNLGLGIDEVDGERQICYNNNTKQIKVVLENTRNTEIDDVQMRVLTDLSMYGPSALDSVYSSGGRLSIKPGQAVVAYFNTTNRLNGTIQKINLFPGVLTKGEIALCVESSIDIEGPINSCD